MNAYLHGPIAGPDGVWHLCWVWRDHPGCESNHDLSYARSRDLVHWTNSAGNPLELPITLSTGEVIDPVPAKGGIINGCNKIGFDNRDRVVVSYHKFDREGNTQVYNARLEDGTWKIHQTSEWDYRWWFEGGGSINFEIGIGPVEPLGNGQLGQRFSHPRHGSGTWRLDERTLRPAGMIKRKPTTPAALREPGSGFPGMQPRTRDDSGTPPDPSTRFLLRWETLPRNRDRPRKGEPPPPSMLRLVELSRK
jgi:hypothetical protein